MSDAASIERWSIPEVAGPIVGRGRDAAQEAREHAESDWRANHARGYEAGMAAARAEVQQRLAMLDERIRRLDSMLQFLAKPLQDLDSEIEQQLARLALTVGKQLARRELKTDPAQVIAIIRDAVTRLPASARDVRVHLHPEDAAVVRERLATPSTDRAWSIVEEPSMSRGGCLVRTDTAQIDARLESRINAIVSSVLGDERSPTRERVTDSAVETTA